MSEEVTHQVRSDGGGRIHFRIPHSAIYPRADLSISRYKQIEQKEIEYEKPDVIMKRVMQLEREIDNVIDELQRMLK